MNKIIILLLLMIICACSSNKQKIIDGIEKIPIEVRNASSDASVFLEKIEITPLETKDSSLIGKPQIRNPTKVSERCGPNRQECDFSSLD